MEDLSTAFRLLDIIQGHPGYEVKCYQCGDPVTDILGVTLPDAGNIEWSYEGARHADNVWGACPRFIARQLEEVPEDVWQGIRVAISQAKLSPRGPYFPAESPE